MNKKAFTLIEILIVIALLGILASLIVGNFFTSLKKGRDAKRKGDLEQTQRALEMYYEDKKAYPTFNIFAPGYQLCETKIGTDASPCGAEKVYMEKVPNDPISGKNYEYVTTAGADYKLYACMENNLQILPYNSLVGSPTIPCTATCQKQDLTEPKITCYWGVSSSNISP